jgi:hypothetical protein
MILAIVFMTLFSSTTTMTLALEDSSTDNAIEMKNTDALSQESTYDTSSNTLTTNGECAAPTITNTTTAVSIEGDGNDATLSSSKDYNIFGNNDNNSSNVVYYGHGQGVPQVVSSDDWSTILEYWTAETQKYLDTIVAVEERYQNVREKCRHYHEHCLKWALMDEVREYLCCHFVVHASTSVFLAYSSNRLFSHVCPLFGFYHDML